MTQIVINAVGLRPADLAHAPRISALAGRGFAAPLETVFPAVTCTVQSTFLTGRLPSQHGIVGNGWYFRDLAQVWLWRQSNHLVQGPKLYETAKERDPSFTCAKMFWWYNMYSAADLSVTPRPEYHADGLKRPGLYSEPAELAPSLQEELGDFPLFQFWGPAADIRSTRWITGASLEVLERHRPSLLLVYLPHLDYDFQRFGPDDPRSIEAVRELDVEVGRLIDAADDPSDVTVLSEYGIEAAERPVFINRWLHERRWLCVQETSHGQLLDAGASRAFAVADHQIAHVYIRDAVDVEPLARELEAVDGIAHVWNRADQAREGLDHERSGELVIVAEPRQWFAYHYWLDETRRPDFAPTVDIHRKPGYDPTELFVDPKLGFPKLRVAKNLAKKLLGFRYTMDVIGTDPSIVGGTHGRRFERPDDGPVFISGSSEDVADSVPAVDVCRRLSDRLFR